MGDVATFARFVVVGLAATGVHYTILTVLMECTPIHFAGIANGIAATFGIAASYIGNHQFVFRSTEPYRKTAPTFVVIYSAVAALHALVLTIWTDWGGFPYRIGFLISAGLSSIVTFVGNHLFVFTRKAMTHTPTQVMRHNER